MNPIILGQILAVVPEFYDQSWHNGKLTIDTSVDLAGADVCQRRKDRIKIKLTAVAVQAYYKYCEQQGIKVVDVVASQVWHSSFDPHTMVPDIEPVPLLQPKPTEKKRSESINQFLNRTSIHNAIKMESSPQTVDEDLIAFSAKTGLSFQTLM